MTRLSGRLASPYYQRYIKSIKWKSKAERWKLETGKCERCGGTDRLEVHHLHYRTLANEQRADVQVLCRSCHADIHESERENAAYWRGYRTWCRRTGRDPEDDHTDEFDDFIRWRAEA